KVLRGGTEDRLLKQLKAHFKQIKHFKPESSRKDSAEMYMIALGFKGKNSGT
ncbi:MAG: SAM-dependent methyltransferase, partial [Alphaproteobacteria bacterium]|nr:SAM-dependent methyltransferase [Alphaproteobacteria bacterium]